MVDVKSSPSDKQTVLIIEDELDVLSLMKLHLEREGFTVFAVQNGEDALHAMSKNKPQLIVLDWMLPGLSGLEICKRIQRQIPVLMVTARAEPADIVLGLEAGADDYVTKPFEIPVFLARVRALLRRVRESSSKPPQGATSGENEKTLRIGNLNVDVERHQVRCGKTEIHLTPSEFKLLVALVQQKGRVLSRDRLIDLVQGEGVVVVDRAIDTHVFGLRKKLGDCSEWVETIRGVGYRVRNDLGND